jgi:hypothetical protein
MAKDKDKSLDYQLVVEGLKDIQAGNVESGMEALKLARELQDAAEKNPPPTPPES